VVEDGVKQSHRLEPPTEDERLYDAFPRELDRTTDILRATCAPPPAARERADYVRDLARLHRSRMRIDVLDRRLGFAGCATTAGSS
jgi:hypothetical protein